MSRAVSSVGPIERFMVDDHARLDRLLAAASQHDQVELALYALFRADLLRHIAMEEKVLLPFARAKRAGEPLEVARALRDDHGVIAKLLLRTPTPALVDELRAILGQHNSLEEGPSGLYAQCDELAGAESADLVQRLRAEPTVPVAPHDNGPLHSRH